MPSESGSHPGAWALAPRTLTARPIALNDLIGLRGQDFCVRDRGARGAPQRAKYSCAFVIYGVLRCDGIFDIYKQPFCLEDIVKPQVKIKTIKTTAIMMNKINLTGGKYCSSTVPPK